jgi:hypothetical protein
LGGELEKLLVTRKQNVERKTKKKLLRDQTPLEERLKRDPTHIREGERERGRARERERERHTHTHNSHTQLNES